MLVNLRVRPRVATKFQKYCKELLQKGYAYDRSEMRYRRNHSKEIFKPYKPCGLEFVKDTLTTFVGVYIDTFGLAETYLPAMTYNRVVQNLVWYGCVDNATQAVEIYNKLCAERPEIMVGNHIILLKRLLKETNGSFRWHKNGYYQGVADAGKCEYFGEEENLDMVYLYNIVQVSSAKEEDFGNIPACNAGRIQGIRKLRILGLDKLAAYAKTCGYVLTDDAGCFAYNGNEQVYFEFIYDDNDNVVDFVQRLGAPADI